jgi:hypothetical protein
LRRCSRAMGQVIALANARKHTGGRTSRPILLRRSQITLLEDDVMDHSSMLTACGSRMATPSDDRLGWTGRGKTVLY